MKILLTRLSSLGDVIHCVPVLSDIAQHRPDVRVDWLIDDSFASVLQYAGDLNQVVALPLRQLKRAPKIQSIKQLLAWWRMQRYSNASVPYDLAIDTQGLLKSAVFQRALPALEYIGLGNQTAGSSYETVSRFFYDRNFAVPYQSHAVARTRELVALALGYRIESIPKCHFLPIPTPDWESLWESLRSTTNCPPGAVAKRFVLLLPGTSRLAKQWPLKNWQTLAQQLALRGFSIVVPQASESEQRDAQQIIEGIPAAIVLPRMTLGQCAPFLAHADLVIGVDSGLTHWASALGRPTIQLYCGDSIRWRTQWDWLAQSIHLGDTNQIPSLSEVFSAIEKLEI